MVKQPVEGGGGQGRGHDLPSPEGVNVAGHSQAAALAGCR